MTQSGDSNFGLLRRVLKLFGLSAEAIDDIVDRVAEWLGEGAEKEARPAEYPYRLRDDFLSPAEQAFYLTLQQAADGWALVFPKVALRDLFFVHSSDAGLFRTYTNRIDRKHVDFVLCHPKTLRPVAGVELDDKSHQRSDRQERDAFVDRVFEAAQLPLVRFAARRAYNPAEIGNLLREAAGHRPVPGVLPPAEPAARPTEPERPKCPQCGSPMVLRTAKSGAKAGQRFWGCPNFPRCRGVVKYEPVAS